MQKNNNSDPLKIAIYGAGSIGCYIGGCFIQAGHRVQLIGRKQTGDALEKHGMHISDWHNNTHDICSDNILFSTNLKRITEVDIIFVTVKNRDCLTAVTELAKSIDNKPVVVGLQNGVQAGELLSKELPNNTVLKGIVAFNVVNNGEGYFHCGTQGDIFFQEHEMIRRLNSTPLAAGFHINIQKNISAIQWTKLIMNLNNAVNALSGIPLLKQLHDPEYRQVMAAIIAEALCVFKARNIQTQRIGNIIPELLPIILNLPTWLFKRVAKAMLNIDAHARSSMYEDLENHRITEIDYLNGEITRLAKDKGIKAPINEQIVKLVKIAEQKKAGSPKLKASDLI